MTTVANELIKQIPFGVKAALGYTDPVAWRAKNGNPGLAFNARILPFNKTTGARGTKPRVMSVQITLNPNDLYDISVGYLTRTTWTEHFNVKDIHVADLQYVLLALDWDGPVPTNPRYWG